MVILLRHTHVDMREGIGHLAPGNCVEEVNLSSRGVEQAKRIGEAFRVHGIAVGEVRTSPYCRCVDTGKLAFGRATPVEYLMPPGVLSESQAKSNQERVLQDIRDHRSSSNLVMNTHDLNISNIVLEPSIAMGDFFVLQPNGRISMSSARSEWVTSRTSTSIRVWAYYRRPLRRRRSTTAQGHWTKPLAR
jgi:phosphohistidine phosphatase SixA